jgi:hypothetical protein
MFTLENQLYPLLPRLTPWALPLQGGQAQGVRAL